MELVVIQKTDINRATRAQIERMGTITWAGLMAPQLDLPIVSSPQLTVAAERQLAIQASHVLQAPLQELEVIEQCGRVCLVGLQRYRQRPVDPVLPFTLVPLGGTYDRAFMGFAAAVEEMARTVEYNGEPSEKLWRKARRFCDQCLAALEGIAELLSVEELIYLVQTLQLSLAWPAGHQKLMREQRERVYMTLGE